MVRTVILLLAATVGLSLAAPDADARHGGFTGVKLWRARARAGCSAQAYGCAGQAASCSAPAVRWEASCGGQYTAYDCAGNVVGREHSVRIAPVRSVLGAAAKGTAAVVRGTARVATAPVRLYDQATYRPQRRYGHRCGPNGCN